MLRRCAGSIARRPRLIKVQTPLFLSSRNEFSTASPKKSPQMPSPPEQTPGSGGPLKKIVFGSIVVGGAVMAAYQAGYIDLNVKDEKPSSRNLEAATTLKHTLHSDVHATLPSVETLSELKPEMEDIEKTEHHHLKDLDMTHATSSEIKSAEEDQIPVKESEQSSLVEETTLVADEQTVGSKISSEGKVNVAGDASSDLEENKQPENSIVENNVIGNSVHVPEESATREVANRLDTTMELSKVFLDEGRGEQKSLADSYSLQAGEVSSVERDKTDAAAAFLNEKEVSADESEKYKGKNKAEDEKIVLDFIEAIHAAEKRQAETDAYIFSEEKRKLKEKYEKELKDARARELMYAEEAAILEKELNKEKAKAVAAMKSLLENTEQKLQEALRHKEEEADLQLKKAQDLAKAELAAAIASEKVSQIEKIAEANMNINALCMAFYARSEEARQTHSVHKLALGTLALEDALSKGLPIRVEVDALHKSLEGIDKDSLLDLVLSSLPEEILNYGADTHMQLNQKFDSLKGILRHFSLIPAGGGGLLAHTVAHIASSIKMREDQSGDGIESLISRVDSYLIRGKFAEAAETLERGVRGTEAEVVVVEWARQARNRAVVDQALSLLQSYATSLTFS